MVYSSILIYKWWGTPTTSSMRCHSTTSNTKAWHCIEHTHLESRLENPWQRTALQSCDQVLQTLCKRKVLHSLLRTPHLASLNYRQEIGTFCPHLRVSLLTNIEKVKVPDWGRLDHAVFCLFCMTISLLSSPEDWGGQIPYETGL